MNASKLKPCQPTPVWRFYDIASHLANTNVTNLENLTRNVSIPKELILPDPQYFRSPFEPQDGDHVTLIALIHLKDERADTEQWLANLEHIYKNLVEQKSFQNIRFLLINSKDSYNPAWVNKVRQNVSFEVYQEMSTSPIGTLLDGDSGDVFIFDRCNLLAYYIRFPLTFIDQKDPFFQATILAAHSDSPCKEKCPSREPNVTKSTDEKPTMEKVSLTTTLTPNSDEQEMTTTVSTVETEIATANAPLINVLSQMGEVLQSFYDRYTMTFQSENETSTMKTETEPILTSSIDLEKTLTKASQSNLTSNLIETLNRTLETYQKSLADVQAPTLSSETVDTKGNGTIKNETLLLTASGSTGGEKLEQKPSSLSTEGCNKTICGEWTTEKLLAARLCCLSFTTDDDEDQVEQRESMINVNASDYVPSNGGFGCKLYARSTCSMIKPVLRCCARKLVNEYFNYAIKLREQQQKLLKSKRVKLGQRRTRSNSVGSNSIQLKNLIRKQQLKRTMDLYQRLKTEKQKSI